MTSSLGLKARVGYPMCIAKVNVMYVPRDPPLLLHIANLLAVSLVGPGDQVNTLPKGIVV